MVDRVEIPTDQPLESVDGQQLETQDTQEQVNVGRPEWLPEKFNSPEDLAKAYKELEKQFTQERQSSSSKDAEPETLEDDDSGQKSESQEMQEQAEEVLTSRGLSLEEFSSYFEEHGELSDEHYQKLEAAGIPKQYVDNYIAGLQALQQQSIQAAFDRVGGEDNFNQMAEWARNNLDKEYLETYNEAVSSGNKYRAMMAIDGLYSRYVESVGKEPNLVHGENGAKSFDFYESAEQMSRDMADPRYKSDPAFRKKVEQKLSRSSLFY